MTPGCGQGERQGAGFVAVVLPPGADQVLDLGVNRGGHGHVGQVGKDAFADEVGGGLREAAGHHVRRIVAHQSGHEVAFVEVLDHADVRVQGFEVLDDLVEVGHDLGLVLHEPQGGDPVLRAGRGAAPGERKHGGGAGKAGGLQQRAPAQRGGSAKSVRVHRAETDERAWRGCWGWGPGGQCFRMLFTVAPLQKAG